MLRFFPLSGGGQVGFSKMIKEHKRPHLNPTLKGEEPKFRARSGNGPYVVIGRF
jgi:hypothetical protein